MTEFKYEPMFQLGEDKTEYYKVPGSEQYVSTSEFEGHKILKVSPEALTLMSNTAFRDVSFMLRRSHNEQVAKILHDPEASANDKYVALTFLRNAEIACKGKLPFCQDTREGPAGMDRLLRRGGAEPRSLQDLHRGESQIFAERPSGHVQGGQHQVQPARAD